MPADWNGILVLYSHGYGPLVAADAPSPEVGDALLARGYALAGSSYSSPSGSLWALPNAVRDQFDTIGAVTSAALPAPPEHVLALGESLGGLVSALEAQQGAGHIDGALTMCGIVAGGIKLGNYQLDAEYTIAKLLASDQSIKLAHFANDAEAAASGRALSAAAARAQTSAQGRARLSLALAFLQPLPVVNGVPVPLHDADAVEAAQFATVFGPFNELQFEVGGTPGRAKAAGGNPNWTLGVNFTRLLHHSRFQQVVRKLYRQAGLDLNADLQALTATADIPADPAAVAMMKRTSVPTGYLDVPELDLHTIYDNFVTVQEENAYAKMVRAAGDSNLLRQAYVNATGHCNFTPAELVAGVQAIRHRVETGRWDSVAQPHKLQRVAVSLHLGGAAFVPYKPGPMVDNGIFNPALNAGPGE